MKYQFSLLLAILYSVQSTKASSINTITTPKADDSTSAIALQAQQTQPTTSSIVKGIDVFGTSQITTKQIRQLWGNKIIQLAEAIYGKKPDAKLAEKLYEEIITGIHAMGDFAYVTLSPVMYFQDGNPVYVTVDVVDKADAAKRIQFRPKPTETLADPDNLLQQWGKYEETAFALKRTGKLRGGYKTCPALGCSFGFEHPDLKKFVSIFKTGVPRNRERLTQILYQDKNATHRGYAAFLLAFTDDAPNYVKTILPAISDSSSLVRNNAIRVLTDIAKNRPDVNIPIEPIINALQYPDTTDRNKAAYVLLKLAKKPENRQIIIQQSVSVLLEMLKLEQPNNHDPAYKILKTLSGRQYDARNYAAWEQWAKEQKAQLTNTNKSLNSNQQIIDKIWQIINTQFVSNNFNSRQVLVGTKTYGRGRVHTGEKIFDDHILLFSVGTLKTPKGIKSRAIMNQTNLYFDSYSNFKKLMY